MDGLWCRIHHYHEAKRCRATSTGTLNQAADDKLGQAHCASADPGSDRAQHACDNPQRSVAEDIAEHCEEQLAGSAGDEIHGVDPESADEWLVEVIRQFLCIKTLASR